MSLEESIKKSRDAQAIPNDKFDLHMKRARVRDIESRRKAFTRQTELDVERDERVKSIIPSVY